MQCIRRFRIPVIVGIVATFIIPDRAEASMQCARVSNKAAAVGMVTGGLIVGVAVIATAAEPGVSTSRVVWTGATSALGSAGGWAGGMVLGNANLQCQGDVGVRDTFPTLGAALGAGVGWAIARNWLLDDRGTAIAVAPTPGGVLVAWQGRY